jgi:hypothetical protein
MIVDNQEIKFHKSDRNELINAFPKNDYFFWHTDRLTPGLAKKVYDLLLVMVPDYKKDIYLETIENEFVGSSKIIVGFTEKEDEAQFIMRVSYNVWVS